MRELVETVVLLGVLQGAILAAVLSTRSANHVANRVLAGLVGALALMLGLGYASRRWGLEGHPHLLGLSTPLPFLFGPLLYLYVTALTRPLVRLEGRHLVHAVPSLANALYMAQAFYFQDGATKVAMVREIRAGYHPVGLTVFSAVQILQALAYLAASYTALRRYERRMRGYYSDLTQIDLRWLTTIVIVNAAVWTVVAVSYVADGIGTSAPWTRALGLAVQVASAFFVFLVGYLSLWQPELFHKSRAAARVEAEVERTPVPSPVPLPVPTPQPEPQTDRQTEAAPLAAPDPPAPEPLAAPDPPAPEPAAAPPPKYQRNRLEDAEADEIAAVLVKLMEEKEPYRDGSLTLQVLADELAVTPHLLSQVLNVRIGKSFYVFVNEYRAEAVKAALNDPAQDHRGVLEIALEAGFNSKSTLNAFFKKHTGMTPTELRKRARR